MTDEGHWPHDQDGLFRCCGVVPPRPGDWVRLTIKDLDRQGIDLKYLRRKDGYDGRQLLVFDVLNTDKYGPQFSLIEHEGGGKVFLADVTELEVTERFMKVGQSSIDLEPDFRDNVEHVYDVKLAVAVGLNFDHEPTEQELREAMLESFIDKVTSAYTFDVDYDSDITYELLTVDDNSGGDDEDTEDEE